MWQKIFDLMDFIEDCLFHDKINRLKDEPFFPFNFEAVYYEKYDKETDTISITSEDGNDGALYPPGEYSIAFPEYIRRAIVSAKNRVLMIPEAEFKKENPKLNQQNSEQYQTGLAIIRKCIQEKTYSPSAKPFIKDLEKSLQQVEEYISRYIDKENLHVEELIKDRTVLKKRHRRTTLSCTLSKGSIEKSVNAMFQILSGNNFISPGMGSKIALNQFLAGEPLKKKIKWTGDLIDLKFFIKKLADRTDIYEIFPDKWVYAASSFTKDGIPISPNQLKGTIVVSDTRKVKFLEEALKCLKKY